MHNDEVGHGQQSTQFSFGSCEETGSGSFTKPLDVHGFCFSFLPVKPGRQASRWTFKNQWEKRCEQKKKGAQRQHWTGRRIHAKKKKQVEQQMRVEGKSFWHGHKLLVHNPKQCVTIAVQLDEKTIRTALRKKVGTQSEEAVSG